MSRSSCEVTVGNVMRFLPDDVALSFSKRMSGFADHPSFCSWPMSVYCRRARQACNHNAFPQDSGNHAIAAAAPAVFAAASGEILHFFDLMKHLHNSLLTLHNMAQEVPLTLDVLPQWLLLTLVKAELRDLRRDVLPGVCRVLLNHLLQHHLDQTFSLSEISSLMDTITAQYLDDESALCSSAALLLLRVLRAAAQRQKSDAAAVVKEIWPEHPSASHIRFLKKDDAGALRLTDRGSSDAAVAPLSLRPKRKRSGPQVEVYGNSSGADVPLSSASTHQQPRRSGGIRPLPSELQQEVLSYLTPRHLVSATATCYTWQRIILMTAHLRSAVEASRAVRRTYTAFLVDDWGEKCLNIASWSSLKDRDLQIDNTTDESAVFLAATNVANRLSSYVAPLFVNNCLRRGARVLSIPWTEEHKSDQHLAMMRRCLVACGLRWPLAVFRFCDNVVRQCSASEFGLSTEQREQLVRLSSLTGAAGLTLAYYEFEHSWRRAREK